MMIKPKSGLVLRHPQTMQPIPPEGGEVPDFYAVRRIRDGDAERLTKRSAQAPAKEA